MEFKYKAAGMSHIIDDFLFVVPPKSNKCLQDLNAFLTLCPKIGISIKDEKTVLPTTVITIPFMNIFQACKSALASHVKRIK
jgi:hypothetical protein